MVIVTAALYGADGLGFKTVLSEPLMDETFGAEYFTALDNEPTICFEPHETTPDLVIPMFPRRPVGTLTTTDESEIQ